MNLTSHEGRKTLWSQEKDKAIIKLVKIHGTKKWATIAKILSEKYHITGKTGKQIRERWNNHLNPDINKEPISIHEGAKIFKYHNEYGNKWAEIVTQLPGRTDNTIKNYFYATVRRHLRKLNKCLRNRKFCENFNLDSKQIKLKFLLNALETGDLGYYQIRKIEDKALIILSTKKVSARSAEIPESEKQPLLSLDGHGDAMDNNLGLLKKLLDLIDVDLGQDSMKEASENDHCIHNQEAKSALLGNMRAPHSNQVGLKRNASKYQMRTSNCKEFMNKRAKYSEQEVSHEEAKEASDNEDDVNFIDIPTVAKHKRIDMMDKATRLQEFQKRYLARKIMRKEGKWNPKLQDCTYFGLNKSPNLHLDLESGPKKITVITNLYTKINSAEGSEFRMNSPEKEISAITEKPDEISLNILPSTPTYFRNIMFSPKQTAENSTKKTADFSFSNPSFNLMRGSIQDQFRRKEFRVPTPGSMKSELPFKPGFTSTHKNYLNPASSLRQVFNLLPSQKANSQNDGGTDNGNSHNNKTEDKKPKASKFSPKVLELDINGITSGNMGGNGLGILSPLNFPLSCNSNSVFPPNTPDDQKFPALDSSKYFNSKFNKEGGAFNMFAPISSPNAFFDTRNNQKPFPISPGGGIFTLFRSNPHLKPSRRN
ncbi:unnamed protein product [Moneuplotes crassus]|uniref:Uncharacterized protein n=1 Tax=Euplotes crassus TaxID=5936 RepID=A0AAD1Y5Q3_EUPCR|nr:unnamed protein product [Moneuplotes crassus]